jgi:hypothetical protein
MLKKKVQDDEMLEKWRQRGKILNNALKQKKKKEDHPSHSPSQRIKQRDSADVSRVHFRRANADRDRKKTIRDEATAGEATRTLKTLKT